MTAADVVLLQETRRKRGQVAAAEREARGLGWNASLQPADTTACDRASAAWPSLCVSTSAWRASRAEAMTTASALASRRGG